MHHRRRHSSVGATSARKKFRRELRVALLIGLLFSAIIGGLLYLLYITGKT